jgi:hypothetical protein
MRSAIDCALRHRHGHGVEQPVQEAFAVAKAEEQQHLDQQQVHDTEQDVAGHDGADIGDLRDWPH